VYSTVYVQQQPGFLLPRPQETSLSRLVLVAGAPVTVALVAIWLATPALACLPRRQMTQAEMACCKKMAGDCNMGTGNHPCCKTVTTAPSPTASIRAKVQFKSVIALIALVPDFECDRRTEAKVSFRHIGLPPPAPPGPTAMLRI